MTRPTSDQIAYLALIDPDASYRLAKRMERFKSNSVLGYRTAGSRAEFETGEMLLEEMRAIGLSDLRKDPFPVDGWEFRKARMQFTDDEDGEHYCELGGYQTNFHTNGWKRFAVVDAGRCTEAELSRLDVRGKLVLADINQRDDWWISYPVYQAYLRRSRGDRRTAKRLRRGGFRRSERSEHLRSGRCPRLFPLAPGCPRTARPDGGRRNFRSVRRTFHRNPRADLL